MCQGGVAYVYDVFNAAIREVFDSEIGDVVETGGFVSETFDVFSDLFLRYFYFLLGSGCDGMDCSVHSQFYMRLRIFCASKLVSVTVC